MSRRISRTSQFKRDVERLQKRDKDMQRLKSILQTLVEDMPLPARFRDHLLVGQYKGTRECHIEPDWLLIYESAKDEVVLIRTGTHADLLMLP